MGSFMVSVSSRYDHRIGVAFVLMSRQVWSITELILFSLFLGLFNVRQWNHPHQLEAHKVEEKVLRL